MSEPFSFKNIKSRELRASLEANNITFNVCFIVAFVYTLNFGLAALWLPLSFVVSMLFYAYYFLPKQISAIKMTGNLPNWLGEGLNPWIKNLILFYILSNFTAYGALELQGFRWFSQSVTHSQVITESLIFLMLGGMLFYLWFQGLQGSVRSDRWQLWMIYSGVTILWIFGISELWGQPLNHFFPGTFFDHPVLALQMLIGFSCVQLLYAENWMRLHAFYKSYSQINTLKVLQQAFIRAAVGNLWILSTPILLGLLARQFIGQTDPLQSFIETLNLLSQKTWGPGFWVLIFAMSMAAIISTMDTFAMAWSACFRLNWRNNLLLYLCSCYIFSFIPLSLNDFYILVSFLLNSLAGPILWRIHYQQNYPPKRFAWIAILTIVLILIYLPLGLVDWLGCSLLLISLLISIPKNRPVATGLTSDN